jgi:hypothetical protein
LVIESISAIWRRMTLSSKPALHLLRQLAHARHQPHDPLHAAHLQHLLELGPLRSFMLN